MKYNYFFLLASIKIVSQKESRKSNRLIMVQSFNYIQKELPTIYKEMKQVIYDIDCVFDGLDGRGAIYISDYRSASLKHIRQSLNIKAVISIASGAYLEPHDELSGYLYIPAKDTEAYDISNHFQDTFNFLQQHRRNGNVLVHCMVGKSRSATIVAAYLLNKFRYSLSTVLNLLRRKRKKVDPNPGFISQLQKYSNRIGIPEPLQSHQSKSLNRVIKTQTSFYERVSIQKQKIRVKQKKIEIERLTSYSSREEEQQRSEVAEKIQKIREKLLKSKKNEKKYGVKMYEGIIGIVSSGSVSLKAQQEYESKQVKSVELSSYNNKQ